MRREERPCNPDEGATEIDAIEAQWTEMWEYEGGLGRPERIRKRVELAIMRRYIQALPKGAHFLDGGCGMGDWVLWFTRAGYPTLGLDVSKRTIEKLNDLFPDMEFAVGDIRATGLRDACIDLYYSWGTFEHFEEGFDPVVHEAFRILKPGGLLLASVPFDNLRYALCASRRGPQRLVSEAGPTRFYQWRLSCGELTSILVRDGFRN